MQHQGNAPVHQSGRVRPPERLLDAQRQHRVRTAPVDGTRPSGRNRHLFWRQFVETCSVRPRQHRAQRVEHRHVTQGTTLCEALCPGEEPLVGVAREGLIRHVRPRIAEHLVEHPHALAQGRGLLPPAQIAQTVGGQVLGYQRGCLLLAQGRGRGGLQGDRPQGARTGGVQSALINRRLRAGRQELLARGQGVLLRQGNSRENARVARSRSPVNRRSHS